METRGSRLATDHATNSVFDDVGSHLFAMIVASRMWEMSSFVCATIRIGVA